MKKETSLNLQVFASGFLAFWRQLAGILTGVAALITELSVCTSRLRRERAQDLLRRNAHTLREATSLLSSNCF